MKRRLLLLTLAVLVALAILGGTTTYLLARDAPFLPGHPLFTVQLWSEKAWSLTLNGDTLYRARILLELLRRRVDALDAVQGASAELAAIRYFDDAVEQAILAIEGAPETDLPALRSMLVSLIERGLTLMDALEVMQQDPTESALLELRARLEDTLVLLSDPDNDRTAFSVLASRRTNRGDELGELTASSNNSLDGARSVPFPSGAVEHSFFPLTGGHDLECSTCHGDGNYEGTSAACIDCHATKDQHFGDFGQECARCHTIQTWQNAQFDHAIIGSSDCASCHVPPPDHFEGACRACHTDTTDFRNAIFDHSTIGGTDCAACHAPPANHYIGTCKACHTDTDNFRNAIFDHSWIGGSDCAACHVPPANHFSGTCSACHTDTGNFRNAIFDHSWIGGSDCAACHNPPANHYSGACRACHMDTGNFRNANFDHSTIGGTDCGACHSPPTNHYGGACRACHIDTGNFRNANFDHSTIGGTDCGACHGPPANHYGGACRACHMDTGNFRNAIFNHSGIGNTDCGACHGPPANHYAGACRNCHGDTGNFFNVNFNHAGLTDCQGCHARPAGHYAGQCSDCHSTNTFIGATFNHSFPTNHEGANGQCGSCHPGGDTSRYNCESCHARDKMDDKHKEEAGYAGDNCVACHADGKKHDD